MRGRHSLQAPAIVEFEAIVEVWKERGFPRRLGAFVIMGLLAKERGGFVQIHSHLLDCVAPFLGLGHFHQCWFVQ